MLGLLLLVGGVGIIASTLFASYNIFTDKNPVPALFSVSDFETESGEKEGNKTGNLSREQEMRKIVQEGIKSQIGNLVPAGTMARLLNLIAWSIFAGIAIFGGTQISKLGISLLK